MLSNGGYQSDTQEAGTITDDGSMLQNGDVPVWSTTQQAWVPSQPDDAVEAAGGDVGGGGGEIPQEETHLIRPHSHQGYWDGGWIGSLSGGL